MEIVTSGQEIGIEDDVKTKCLLYQINYKEILPYYKKWNPLCVDPPYMYNKNYASKHYWMQLYKIADYIDYCVIIKHPSDTYSNNIIKYLEKMNKKYTIFEEL